MSIVSHTFPVSVAVKVGVENAVMLSNIYFWVEKNRANGKNFHDGRYWTYNSMKAFEEIFPYWTFNQIRRVLTNLEKEGYIVSGNYNKVAYDRTKWYALTQKAFDLFCKTNCDNEHNHLRIHTNGFKEGNKAIPDINTDNKPDSKPYTDDMHSPSVAKSVKEKNSKRAIIARLLDNGVNEELAEEYWHYRTTIKKDRPTDRAISLLINECIANNFNLSEAIEIMIARGWKGFKYQWLANERNKRGVEDVEELKALFSSNNFSLE